jgi:hypothetical protein
MAMASLGRVDCPILVGDEVVDAAGRDPDDVEVGEDVDPDDLPD